MTPRWIDRSSHSRGDSKVPNAWECQIGQYRLTVHRFHGADGWFWSCPRVDVRAERLMTSGPAEAQREALLGLRWELEKAVAAIAEIETMLNHPSRE